MTTLILLPRKGFWDEDLLKIVELLYGREETGIATLGGDPAYGKLGCKVIPDYSVKNILLMPKRPFKNLIIVADEGWKDLYDIDVKTLIAGFLMRNKKIIAISLAPLLLAKFGYLKNKKGTFNFFEFPEYQKLFEKYGAIFLKEPIARDSNIITCVGRLYIDIIKQEILRKEEAIKTLDEIKNRRIRII